jgi:hypothetical protein
MISHMTSGIAKLCISSISRRRDRHLFEVRSHVGAELRPLCESLSPFRDHPPWFVGGFSRAGEFALVVVRQIHGEDRQQCSQHDG